MDHTPEWLRKLQEESWQAEMLVSGGAIIALASLFMQLGDVQAFLLYGTTLPHILGTFIFVFLTFSFIILIGGFLLHLCLRGYWIALIGLNYVYPDGVNQERMKFKGEFSTFIKGNSNTPFLVALDKGCSQVFALTFFLVFSIGGMFLFMGFVVLLVLFLILLNVPLFLRRFVIIFFIAIAIVAFIDFLTFGRLKRIGWLSKIYYPFHYVLSRLTLSFVYRRYYYTIVSNISAWKIVLGLTIVGVAMAVLFSSGSSLPRDIGPTRSGAEESFLIVKDPIVRNGSLEFSILRIPMLEESQPDFEKFDREQRIELVTNLYEIRVDTTVIRDIDWLIEDEYLGIFTLNRLRTAINVDKFDEGRHDLFIRIRSHDQAFRISDDLNYYAHSYFLIRR